MSTLYKSYHERYKELRMAHNITKNVMGSIPYDEKTRMSTNELAVAKQRLMEKYDVVIEYAGTGYAHTKYRVLKNEPGLSTLDLAIICDDGNLCFGYRTEGSIICVHTD